MWTVFFVIALIGTMILLIYLVIELNELEKKIYEVSEDLRKHFEHK